MVSARCEESVSRSWGQGAVVGADVVLVPARVVAVVLDVAVPESGARATVVEVTAGAAVLVGCDGGTVVLGSVCFGTVVVWRWVVVVALTTEIGTAVGGVVRTSR
jgi:hypothetical protein